MRAAKIILLLLAVLPVACFNRNPGRNFDKDYNSVINKKAINGDTVVFNCIVYKERFDYYTDSITIDNKVKYPLSVLTQKRINDGTWELIYFTKDVSDRINSESLKKAAIKGIDLVIRVMAVRIDPKGKWNGINIIKIIEVPGHALLRNINEL